MVLGLNPISEYVVAAEAVLDCTINHVVPPSVDLSISYPVIVEPPLSDGAVQDRLICDVDADVAVRPVGGCGTAIVAPDVVADAVFDGELVPTELIAETR